MATARHASRMSAQQHHHHHLSHLRLDRSLSRSASCNSEDAGSDSMGGSTCSSGSTMATPSPSTLSVFSSDSVIVGDNDNDVPCSVCGVLGKSLTSTTTTSSSTSSSSSHHLCSCSDSASSINTVNLDDGAEESVDDLQQQKQHQQHQKQHHHHHHQQQQQHHQQQTIPSTTSTTISSLSLPSSSTSTPSKCNTPATTTTYYDGSQAVSSKKLTDLMPMAERHKLTCAPPMLVMVMVGLPGCGKSFIARKLERFLHWKGYATRAFNVATYRRKQKDHPLLCSSVFDPENAHGSRILRDASQRALEDTLR